MNFGTAHGDILSLVIVDFFFWKIFSSGDDFYGSLILLLYSWRSSSFFHPFIPFKMLRFNSSLQTLLIHGLNIRKSFLYINVILATIDPLPIFVPYHILS